MVVGSATTPTTTATTPPASSASAPSTKNLVDYNSFLQLLVAQMQNQDPTSPTDSTQYLSQLASFSAVEQQTQTNSKLDQLIQSSGFNQADSLIGRTVASADGSVSGKVVSVTMSASGMTATLDSGTTMPITQNITVS